MIPDDHLNITNLVMIHFKFDCFLQNFVYFKDFIDSKHYASH